MHEMNAQMMHALMHWKLFNFTLYTINRLEHRVLVQKPQSLKNPIPNIQPNWSLIITLVRQHHIMT